MLETKPKIKIDLESRTYAFSLAVIRFIDQLNKADYTLEVIIKQLLRSAASVGANVVEAQAGSSRKDFINFYHHTLKSANETKFWLRLLKDFGKTYLDLEPLLKEATELANILGACIVSLKKAA